MSEQPKVKQPTPDAEARATLIAELCAELKVMNTDAQFMRAEGAAEVDNFRDNAADWVEKRGRTLADLLAAEGWRDISVYPKDAEYRLLYSSAHGQVVGAHVTGDVWHLVGVGAITDASSRPTHWMPLPTPPGGTR